MDRRGFLRGAAVLPAAGVLAYAGGGAAAAQGGVRTRARDRVAPQDWMAPLAASTALRALTIPGSHDSGARFGGAWVECQDTSIADQLAAGIRFLDVRCRAIDGVFAIHHGAFFQELMFGDVLIACRDFLAAHPGETVVMRVKQEYSTVSDEEFRAIFDVYLDQKGWRSLFRLQDTLPTLGEARGKVVLLADNGGLPGVRWADTALFDVQDDYQAEPFAKFPKITEQFREAAAHPGPFYVNFVSTAAGLPPVWNADRLNPQVRDFLNGSEMAGRTGLGIVPMDFPQGEPGLLEAVLAHNPTS
ncbi:phosphatidylinositol-specific phospholipase C [Streptomyces smyrnaeus]|uniref:phosphatidylinositol-specific phospholipase C n=1 Tax=Streptomyces TaxID=1883 RepID=UPI001B39AE35|nr:phosphatidylinositol-specific phospholipase C [Streptomyces sp. RK75]MBQ0865977.1 phosphatidylinositol-specific phospholipase C [Streptomyces sp. RK75]MBQ1161160.1 phosphatidylinositol-specific phospholipase C [Streptomyces sp. A73]